MAIAQKTVDYAVEVDTIMSLVISVVKDVKGGKAVSDVLTLALPGLLGAFTGLSQLTGELAASPKTVEETVGYRVGELVAAFTGAV